MHLAGRVDRFTVFLLLLLLTCGFPWRLLAHGSDPGAFGPYPWEQAGYTGEGFFPTPGRVVCPEIDVLATVYYPSPLDSGPFPLLVFIHGASAVPDCYLGFGYLGELLASHGFIVVSIGAMTGPHDLLTPDLGMRVRAELIQHHLEKWREFNETGGEPFDQMFVGKVDLSRIGTLGHSRGGEGVVRHFLLNQNTPGSAFDVRAVFSIAPTNLNRFVINRINEGVNESVKDVPFAVMLPYCDGDVTNLAGIQYFDDALYTPEVVASATRPKHAIVVKGANHNFYNTIWEVTLGDEIREKDTYCSGSSRLTADEQQLSAATYAAAFFRTYLLNEAGFIPLLRGEVSSTTPEDTRDVHVSFHAPRHSRLDINRIDRRSNMLRNTLCGEVQRDPLRNNDIECRVEDLFSCGEPSGKVCGDADYVVCGHSELSRHCSDELPPRKQPHTAESLTTDKLGLTQLGIGWDDPAVKIKVYVNEIPAPVRDFSAYHAIQFRAAVDFSDERNVLGKPQDFVVLLRDGNGRIVREKVGDHSEALYYPPGDIVSRDLPKLLSNTVRIPLSRYGELDLTNVVSVEFEFSESTGGFVFVSDLALTGFGPPAVESAVYETGDVNDDGALAISDSIFLLNHLFTGNNMANCQASADINGDWAVDLSDAICLLYYLFNGLCEPRTFGCGRFPVLGQECVSSLCASR